MEKQNKRGGFRPGAGRKKKVDEDRIKDLALDSVVDHFGSERGLFDYLCDLALNAKSSQDRLRAASLLLPYVYGKPTEKVEVTQPEVEEIKLIEWVKPTN